jgi:polysaccharide chain length determinant protein (PEP-CTERM system associated)
MESFDLTKYWDMAVRRIWWITIPFLLIVLAGLAYLLAAPRIYEAKTLILVQPQRVPEDFVRTIVSTTVEERLQTITQQVTSRTNLEGIIKEHDLFGFSEKGLLRDEMVAELRERIHVEVSHRGRRGGDETSAFTISFRDREPRKAMEITNALASNFIAENLRLRESQAIGTAAFLFDELASIEKRLSEKEEELKGYRERYMGGLPEQLETNLNIIERLQGQLDRLHSNLRDAENRKIFIQTQIADQKRAGAEITLPSSSGELGSRDIASLRSELASLESRYTQNHPDVIRLKGMISGLEAEVSDKSNGLSEEQSSMSTVDPSLVRQLRDIGLEIENLKAGITKTQTQIEWYQARVAETPKREQELLALNRDYENLKDLYNSLLNRKLEAEIAVSMERKQKGEQFRVIDPAKMPDRPAEPDMRKIFFLTLVLGMGVGCGLAYLAEVMDTSYKAPEEVEEGLQLPVLVSLPIRYTENELRKIRINKILTVASIAAGFIVSAFSIVLAVKGVEGLKEFIKGILGGV